MGNQSAASATQAPQQSIKQPIAQDAGPAASTTLTNAKPRKAALLIGCRYKNHKYYAELPQTHRDVFKLRNLLINKYHYERSKVTILLDDGRRPAPTRVNIVSEIKKLVEGAKAGDNFFFHYSGHGAQTPCQVPGEEDDDMDEAIVPCDATEDKDTWIIDNDLHRLLVRKIPVNSQLIAFFDMCHSGTAMDLKHYCYNENGTIHQYRRTSNDTIEDESRKIRQLTSHQPSAQGQDASAPKVIQRKNTRHFQCTKRMATMQCELSESSDPDTLTAPPVENGDSMPGTGTTALRCNSCTECGGIIQEGYVCDSPSGPNPGHDQQGFVPERPLDNPSEQQEPLPQPASNVATRRFTYPLGHGAGCLSALRMGWLTHFFKRKFSISGNNEKAGQHAEPNPPSRVSTVTSITPLSPSTNPSISVSTSAPTSPTSSPVLTYVTRPPKTSLNVNGNSIHISTGQALQAIKEDVPTSRFTSEHVGEIPRCTSPISGPASPASSHASETPISTSSAAIAPKRFMTTAGGRFRKKCKCRTFSGGDQEYGQTITIGSSSDEQLAWETSKGTLTSALVSILEKEAHPTYKSLLASVQGFLNNMSDDMRRHVSWTKNRSTFKSRKGVRERGSPHESEQDFNESLLEAFNPILEQANGGPVQTAIIGTQKYMNLAAARFSP